MITDPSWFCVYTAPRQEADVVADLHRLGLWTFYPFERVRVRKRLPGRERFRVSWEEHPYFPRYLFCRAPPGQIALVYGLEGVVTVLGSGGLPRSVPDDVMDILMTWSEDGSGQIGASDDTTRKGRGFVGKVGDAVGFVDGDAWEHVVAQITSLSQLDKKGRVEVRSRLGKASVEVNRLKVEV